MSTSTADVYRFLDRLDKVQSKGPERWAACCPAHDDRGPSLSVRVADDGKLLVHCFAGCGAADVVAAVGLELSDLFPKRDSDTWGRPVAATQRWVPRDVLAAVAREALIAVMAAEATHRGESLSDDDLQRLSVAAGRLRSAAREVGYEL
ncbi:CHC2 zinc finger domain-containing protein [Halomonas piscis]|uniref:CHC2 zinc finger domain-containing protein n=1 Tax=Halomonas piscis TaxID=3031727 RepID=A0ABY9YYE3_9GAMM|nr:CHC2 zinc finger domain-containing protein [Halomonas piscis]WNK19360.1 CHC2 zinc finger domain-containing protein [Halomonas piscis]